MKKFFTKAKIYFYLFLFYFIFKTQKALAYDFINYSGLGKTAEKSGHTSIPLFNTNSPLGIIGVIIGVVLSLLGVIFLALTVYGGFLWMTASGNEEQITKAKKILKNSIIGIIIVMSAYAVTVFVGSFFG